MSTVPACAAIAPVPAAPRVLPPALPAPALRHAQLTAPAREYWVGNIRRRAGALLAQWHLAVDDRYSAVLIVGELIANAACHGRSQMTLRLTLRPRLLHIYVSDHGAPSLRATAPPDHDPDEHGRGMAIVRAISAWVEVVNDETGHEVWTALGLAPTSGPR